MSYSGLVELAVYDLSRGMAKQYLGSLLGIDIEAIYHTGVRVYGYEYFFSDGIQKMKSEDVVNRFGMTPFEIVPMGETELPEELIDSFVEENRSRFSSETYDLLNHNCNNFSNELVNFLLGVNIPEKIINLPQTLLNTPQGKMIAPLLEQMGATKAIPLSVSNSSSSTPSTATTTATQSNTTINTSCLSSWKNSPVSMVLSHLQHCSRTPQSDEEITIIKLCYLIYQRSLNSKPCFYALEQCISLIDMYSENEAMTPLLYDMFYLLAFNLPFILDHITSVQTYGYSLLEQLATSMMTNLLVLPSSSPLYLAFTLCLISLASTPYGEILWSNSLFSTFLQTLVSSLSREEGQSYSMGVQLLANLAAAMPKRGEAEDPSEETLLLLNALGEGICEETNVEWLRMRIAGLSLLVQKGGMMEKISLQSYGVCSDSSIQVGECREMWNKLVSLCEN